MISAVVIWDVAIKRRLSITARHADWVATLPMHHQDPFDRILVAQAEVDGLTLGTDDAAVRRYDGVEVPW